MCFLYVQFVLIHEKYKKDIWKSEKLLSGHESIYYCPGIWG